MYNDSLKIPQLVKWQLGWSARMTGLVWLATLGTDVWLYLHYYKTPCQYR